MPGLRRAVLLRSQVVHQNPLVSEPSAHRNPGPGHVFVLNGRLEHLRADVHIVPTDRAFDVQPSWWRVFGNAKLETVRPTNWDRDRSGQAPGQPGVWFLDVVRSSVEELTSAVAVLLHRVVEDLAGAGEVSGRSRPLIAMPPVGGRHGGFRGRRGEVIAALLDTVERVVAERGIDVVIVAIQLPTYSALQATRRHRAIECGEPFAAEGSWHRQLGRRIQDGEVALFLGAGVSMSAGLPSWQGLLAELTEVAKGTEVAGRSDLDLSGLSPLDQAQLLAGRLGGDLGAAVKQVIEEKRAGRIGLTHGLVAGFRCRETVTTNFDLLYELAVADVSGGTAPATVPSATPTHGPWVLKLHGDVTDPASIVLSREHFVSFAGGSAARGAVLQSLMMTRHLLVVGASFSDDNLLRLLYEVKQLPVAGDGTRTIGTVLTVVPDAARGEILGRDFDFIAASDRAEVDPIATRALEIELDHVGVFACSDASYALDADFAGLLTPEESEVAQSLRAVLARVQAMDRGKQQIDAWQAIRESLESFGAPSARSRGRSR